jgi:hypothetical protein
MSALVVLLVGEDEEVIGAELVVDGAAAAPLAAGALVEPHAARPIGSAAARATKTVARRAFLVRAFMVRSYFRTGVLVVFPALHLVFGGAKALDWVVRKGFSSRNDDDDLLDAA